MEDSATKKLPIFHAGSLTAVFAKVNVEFKKLHPDVEIVSEAAGSVDAVRKITEQKRECGVLASADYRLIPNMMLPDYTDWYVVFASDEIVLSYSEKSRYQSEVNKDNWYEILQRTGVTYALHDPNRDPGGYRTLMVWQLAEKYYGVPGLYEKLRGSPGYRILPQTEQADYTFTYRSVATRNNLKFVSLPENINLSSNKLSSHYALAKVEIKSGSSEETIILNGEPILFALTIPRNFPDQELAINWVSFLLSDDGITIMKSMGMKPLEPAIADDIGRVPLPLNNRVVKAHSSRT